jgi:hypothetical protein
MRFLTVLALAAILLGCDSDAPPDAEIQAVRTTSHEKTVSVEGTTPESPQQKPPEIEAVLDKTFDDIKFEMVLGEPFRRSMLSDDIEALAGKRICIRGYILPTPQKLGIQQFVLVRDNQECCFGPGAALYDCILVKMEAGKTAEFSLRPVTTIGRFSIEELIGPDGNHLAIYRLEAESVR